MSVCVCESKCAYRLLCGAEASVASMRRRNVRPAGTTFAANASTHLRIAVGAFGPSGECFEDGFEPCRIEACLHFDSVNNDTRKRAKVAGVPSRSCLLQLIGMPRNSKSLMMACTA